MLIIIRLGVQGLSIRSRIVALNFLPKGSGPALQGQTSVDIQSDSLRPRELPGLGRVKSREQRRCRGPHHRFRRTRTVRRLARSTHRKATDGTSTARVTHPTVLQVMVDVCLSVGLPIREGFTDERPSN